MTSIGGKKSTSRTWCTTPLKRFDKCTSHYVMVGNRMISASDVLALLCCFFFLLSSIKCHLKHNKLLHLYPVTVIQGNHKVKTEAAIIIRQRKCQRHCRKTCHTQLCRTAASVGEWRIHFSLILAQNARKQTYSSQSCFKNGLTIYSCLSCILKKISYICKHNLRIKCAIYPF